MPHFTIRKDKNTFSMNDQPEAKIIERHGGTIVVRCPGYREQHGRGLSSYKFSEYQVWQITEIEDLGEILQGDAEWVIDFPASPKLQGKHIVHSTSTA